MPASIPSLPQNDPPAQQQQRRDALAQQQQVYVYNFDSPNLKPLGVAAEVPSQDKPTLAWFDGVVTTGLQLVGNLLSIAAKLFNNGQVVPAESGSVLSRVELKTVEDFHQDLTDGFRLLSERMARLHQAARTPTTTVSGAVEVTQEHTLLQRADHLMKVVGAEVVTVAEAAVSVAAVTSVSPEADSIADDIGGLLKKLFEMLLSDVGKLFLRYLGLYGKASALDDYSALFSLLLVPPVISTYDTDLVFARMRLAGPNPLVIQRIGRPDPRFPVTEAQFQAVMGSGDSLARAGTEGRLFLTDYSLFEGIPSGSTSGGQKYIEAPLALFAVPAAEASDRRLRAVAIQLSQKTGAAIFTPGEGTAWQLARLFVQVADGNYHELISHLGLTHLVLEEFAMATPRQLSVQHPLYLLLTPHFQGTLFINDSAEKSLIASGGPVDQLLGGEIGASIQLCIQAVSQHRINQAFLPRALALRGVDDPAKLPDYPYRDDALLLWKDIHTWVGSYLALYYSGDADVQADYELQAWVKELGSSDGGKLQDIGEANGGIQSLAYLVDLTTYVLFTASVQHAAVNFPQRTLMSYTPALPLASYAPAPASVDPNMPPSELLVYLPPLQMATLQQAILFGLGNVYFTRLGHYDAYLREPWFGDPRVSPLVESFQARLRVTEQEIGRRNLSRIPYDSLLPSAIPQSINI